MRYLAALLAALFALSANAQVFTGTAGGGFSAGTAGGGGGELFNNTSLNIFDTYDPLCDPDTAASDGIIFCDGFEDGELSPGSNVAGSVNDYWHAASASSVCTGCLDPEGRAWAEINTGTIDEDKADFGAAGTNGTGTQGWNRGIEPSHCFMSISGDPGDCEDNPSSTSNDIQDLYFRGYFKLAGVTSTRCASGWPDCTAFTFGTSNPGSKLIELRDGLDTGGITYPGVMTQSEASGNLDIFADDPGTCIVGTGETNAGKTCASGVGPGAWCSQHLGALDFYDHLDEWIFIELHIEQSGTADASTLELWMDACGRDGLGCTGTPTQRISVSNWSLQLNGSGCSLPNALYLNAWNPGSTNGEIQWDEIVVRDGDVVDSPIGFFESCLGGC